MGLYKAIRGFAMARVKVCRVEGCDRERYRSWSLCSLHAGRLAKYGDANVNNRWNMFRSGRVKLLPEDVLTIKEALKNPYHGQMAELARIYGVTRETIRHIKIGKTWDIDVAMERERQIETKQRVDIDLTFEFSRCIREGCDRPVYEKSEKGLCKFHYRKTQRCSIFENGKMCMRNDRLINIPGYGLMCALHWGRYRVHGNPLVNKNRDNSGGRAKLSLYDVRDIKEALRSPYRGMNKDLAKKYGVSTGLISSIKLGRAWNIDIDREIARQRESGQLVDSD